MGSVPCALPLQVVGKLRKDASLVYPYGGPQKPRGRRRVYGERVQWTNLDPSHWQDEGELEKGVRLHSAVLHHRSLASEFGASGAGGSLARTATTAP